MLKKVIQALLAAILICYPLIIYLGLEALSLKALAGIVLGLFVLRLVLLGGTKLKAIKQLGIPVAMTGVTLSAASLLFDSSQLLLMYPLLVSLCCLCTFAWSLIKPPSMIECFARMADDDLPDEAIGYTRKVTYIWCLFFSVNSCIALYTIVNGDFELWTLYNGLISYLLMGILLGSEWLYRKWVLKV